MFFSRIAFGKKEEKLFCGAEHHKEKQGRNGHGQ